MKLRKGTASSGSYPHKDTSSGWSPCAHLPILISLAIHEGDGYYLSDFFTDSSYYSCHLDFSVYHGLSDLCLNRNVDLRALLRATLRWANSIQNLILLSCKCLKRHRPLSLRVLTNLGDREVKNARDGAHEEPTEVVQIIPPLVSSWMAAEFGGESRQLNLLSEIGRLIMRIRRKRALTTNATGTTQAIMGRQLIPLWYQYLPWGLYRSSIYTLPLRTMK